MFGYLAAYAGGIVTGVGLLLAYQYSVKRAVKLEQAKAKRDADKLRSENARPREDCQAYELSAETARARAAGNVIGIQEGRNMSQAENLVRGLDAGGKHHVQIGGASK